MEEALRALGRHFIGLWCFRELDRPRRYAVTLNVDGDYWDTTPKPTMEATLLEANRVLERALAQKQGSRT